MRLAVIPLSLALVGCGTVKSYIADPEPPQISVQNIQLESAGIFNQVLKVTLAVANPNDFDLDFDSMRFALDLNEQPVANGLVDEDFEVRANATQSVDVDVTVPSQAVLNQIRCLFDTTGVAYTIYGEALLSSGNLVPFQHSDSLEFSSMLGGS